MSNIAKILNDLDNFKTRSGARKKLVDMGPDEVGSLLLSKALSDSPENSIWAIVEILKEWKWSGATETLLELMARYSSLEPDICNALKEITGLDLEPDVELWRKMLEAPGVISEVKEIFSSDEILSFDIHQSFTSIVIPLPQSRRQEVLVYEKSNGMTLYTECGEIHSEQKKHVQDFNNRLSWAELAVTEEGALIKATLTAQISQDAMTAALLKESILKVAELADSLEEQLTGKDKI